jgi:hypothetical protein
MADIETDSVKLFSISAFFRQLTGREFSPHKVKNVDQLVVGNPSDYAMLFLASLDGRSPYWLAYQGGLCLRKGGFGPTAEIAAQNIEILRNFAVAWISSINQSGNEVLISPRPGGVDVSQAEYPSFGLRFHHFTRKTQVLRGRVGIFTSGLKPAPDQ